MVDKHMYADIMFVVGENNRAEVYYDASAVVLAIKNILLSRPGNFPETPSLGMHIQKYQFETLDDETLTDIETELSMQINKYVQSANNVSVNIVKIIKDEDNPYNGIGISVSTIINGSDAVCNFMVLQDHEDVAVAVEIN